MGRRSFSVTRLSSKGRSPIPRVGSQHEGYRRAYEDFVLRFSEALNSLASLKTPGQVVRVDPGDLLWPWYEARPARLETRSSRRP